MIYKDAKYSIQDRVEDLIGRMTVIEKVAQLTCANSYGGESVYDTRYEKLKDGIGTISYLNDSLTGDNKKDKETVKNTSGLEYPPVVLLFSEDVLFPIRYKVCDSSVNNMPK